MLLIYKNSYTLSSAGVRKIYRHTIPRIAWRTRKLTLLWESFTRDLPRFTEILQWNRF